MSAESEASKEASGLRVRLDLGEGPIADLIDIFTQLGVDVVVSTPATQGQHGMTYYDPKTQRLVVAVGIVNNAVRHRSNLAHELGHIRFKDFSRDESYSRRGPNETRAQAFARHFLFPLSAARQIVDRWPDPEARMNEAIERFGVSPTVAAIQFKAIGALTEEESTRLTSKKTSNWYARRYGWVDKLQSDNAVAQTHQAPRGLMRRAMIAYQRGLLPIGELARWQGMPVSELEQLLDAEDIVVHPHPDGAVDFDDEPDELPPLP